MLKREQLATNEHNTVYEQQVRVLLLLMFLLLLASGGVKAVTAAEKDPNRESSIQPIQSCELTDYDLSQMEMSQHHPKLYGSAEAPLSQWQVDELVAQLNAENPEENPWQRDSLQFAYVFSVAQWQQLGVNFGYADSEEFIITHTEVMNLLLKKAGLAINEKITALFIVQNNVALPASYDPGWRIRHVNGLYGLGGYPSISPDYLGPETTGHEHQIGKYLIDEALLHELGHLWEGWPDIYTNYFDFRDKTPLALANVPVQWLEYSNSMLFRPQETLMNHIGLWLDPEVAWLLAARKENQQSQYDENKFRELSTFRNLNLPGDSVTLEIPEWLNDTTLEVFRTKASMTAAQALSPTELDQLSEAERKALVAARKDDVDLLETASVKDQQVTIQQPFADLGPWITQGQSSGLLVFKDATGVVVGVRPFDSGLFLFAQPLSYDPEKRLQQITIALNIAHSYENPAVADWSIQYRTENHQLMQYYEKCFNATKGTPVPTPDFPSVPATFTATPTFVPTALPTGTPAPNAVFLPLITR